MTLTLNRAKLAEGLLIAFLAFSFAGLMLQVQMLFYAAVVSAFAGLCLGDNNYRVGLCFMLVPNIRLFDGLSVSYLVAVMLAFPAVVYIFESKRVNFKAAAHVIMLSLWEVIHTIAMNNMHSIFANLGSIMVLYYVECVLVNKDIKLNYSEIARKFAFGCIFSSAMFMSFYFGKIDLWKYLTTWRLKAFANDPNYYALYMCVAIAMLFTITSKHKVRDYIYIFILVALILFTSSKMGLAVTLLMFIFFAFKSLLGVTTRRFRFVRRLMIGGLTIATIFSRRILILIDNTLISLQEHKGTDVNIDPITSNRIMIMQFYLGELVTNIPLLLFGYGFQYNETAQYYVFSHISHNTYLDVVLSWGLVGVAMMFVIFFNFIVSMKKNRTEKLGVESFLPLLITGITFIALSCLNASMFWWIICAALLPLKGRKDEKDAADIGSGSRLQHRKISVKLHKVSD